MKKIILFGAGECGSRVAYLLTKDCEVVAFADNDPKKQGNSLFNKPIIAPARIQEYEFDLIIISNYFGKEVEKQLIEELGISRDKIVDYYRYNFYDIRIATLRMTADEINDRKIQGNVAELGVFKGEFAQYINELFPDRKLYLFDTFEGFNKNDVDLEVRQGYSQSIIGEYCNQDVELVLSKMKYKDKCLIKKGYFPESAKDVDDIFAFVSIDVDLYQPIYEGLKYFYPRLARGGYIFVHDYSSGRYFGVREAVRSFCHNRNIGFVPVCDMNGSIIIAK